MRSSGSLGLVASLALAGSTWALNIQVGNIIPPGGNQQSAYLASGTDLSLFASGSGLDRLMSAAEINALDDIAALYSGSLVAISMNTAAGTSLILMSDSSFSVNSYTASSATAGYDTGGLTVVGNGNGGLLGWGSPALDNDLYAFAIVGLTANTTGAMTLARGSTTDVRFLKWTGSTWALETTGTYASNGTINFNYQVLPIPAPLALGCGGLAAAVVLRRWFERARPRWSHSKC